MYRDTGKLPDRIQNKPKILPGLQLYLTAFFDLDRERSIGYNGREPLRRRAISEYGEDHDFSHDQYERLHALIPEMDEAFLKRLEEKRPKT